MIHEKKESPHEAEGDGEHQVQGELEVRGHVLAPEEVWGGGHDGDDCAGAQGDQGHDHHVVTHKVQLSMLNAPESEDQEAGNTQNLIKTVFNKMIVLWIDIDYLPTPLSQSTRAYLYCK